MKKTRILIADDEPIVLRGMKTLLKEEKGVDLVGECTDGRMALEEIRRLRPDLVFLDIQMPELDGFEVIERIGIEKMPHTVFVTAYDKYAVEAFRVNAIDYLLKPFSPERFKESLSRAIRHVQGEQESRMSSNWLPVIEQIISRQRDIEASIHQGHSVEVQHGYLQRVVIKSRGRVILLKVEEIDWIEAAGAYVRVRCRGEQHLLRERLGAIERRLRPDRFTRIHRSTIVNIEKIKELQPLFYGDYQVVLLDGTKLTLSRRYRDRIAKALQQPI